MAELEINLFTIIFGTLILGLGYIGLFLRYLFFGKNFYKLKIVDKIIQSIILGTISFVFVMRLGFLKIAEITNEQEILAYVIRNPSIFIYQFFFVMVFIYYIIIIELIFKKIIRKK